MSQRDSPDAVTPLTRKQLKPLPLDIEPCCDASEQLSALTARLHTVERERDQWVEDFGMFTVDTCPIGEHATYAFDAEGNTACPGCTIDALTQQRDRYAAVLRYTPHLRGCRPFDLMDNCPGCFAAAALEENDDHLP